MKVHSSMNFTPLKPSRNSVKLCKGMIVRAKTVTVLEEKLLATKFKIFRFMIHTDPNATNHVSKPTEALKSN
jgi:hypothetical protein